MTKNEVVHFKKFKLSQIMSDSIVILIGKRRSGKSWLTREIMYTLSKRGMPYGKVYSGTEHCNPFFRKFFPALFIDQKFNDDALKTILESQRKKVKKTSKKLNKDDGRTLENNMLLIFDDMMSDDDIWKKSKYFKKLFTEGRHYNILFIMSIQYVLGIPPALRDNIDYVFIFAHDGNNLKKLYENYAGIIPSFDMFKKIFFECTRDKGCLVLDKTNTSENLTDKVFYFRATDPPPKKFRFGNPSFWKLHDDRYQSSDDESDSSKTKSKLENVIDTYGANGKKYYIQIGD